MIPRYTRKEMSSIWSDEERFRIWLEVETVVLEELVQEGLAPREAAQAVRTKGAFDANRILEIEGEVKHDVIAFLTNVNEHVGEGSQYLHRGMTSNDLLDTAFGVQLKRSGSILIDGLDKVLSVLKGLTEKWKLTPCIGRSHGIHAEPTTFGIKCASWFAEFGRARARLSAAIDEVSVGKIAGPVGTYSSLPPSVEKRVLQRLGLGIEPVPSQVVHRDRHAAFFSAIALVGNSVERLATEIRHLQRSEVREVEEPFTKGQKGSSAMPHKRNPILSENLCGLARLLRGYSISAMENVALWHERDISHSSVERVIAPDACIVLDFMLHRLHGLLDGLVVYPEKMMENLMMTRGVTASASVLVRLTEKGMSREDAYQLVQQHALAAYDAAPDFKSRLLSCPKISAVLSASEIEELCGLERHLRHVEEIVERALTASP